MCFPILGSSNVHAQSPIWVFCCCIFLPEASGFFSVFVVFFCVLFCLCFFFFFVFLLLLLLFFFFFFFVFFFCFVLIFLFVCFFLPEASSRYLLHVFEQQRLWRDCAYAQTSLSLCWLPT